MELVDCGVDNAPNRDHMLPNETLSTRNGSHLLVTDNEGAYTFHKLHNIANAIGYD